METAVSVSDQVSDSESGYSSSNESSRGKENHRCNSTNTTGMQDETDARAGATDCLEKGNVVHMMVSMDGTDMYMAVDMQQIVTQSTAVGDSTKISFTWKNLINTDFGIILQNDSLFKGRAIGVEILQTMYPSLYSYRLV